MNNWESMVDKYVCRPVECVDRLLGGFFYGEEYYKTGAYSGEENLLGSIGDVVVGVWKIFAGLTTGVPLRIAEYIDTRIENKQQTV